MTAVLIAKYIEDGRFSWDSTLAEVLPQWRGRMQIPYRNVTIAQLASHHSGFTDGAAGQWAERNELDLPPNAALQGTIPRNASAVDGRLLLVEKAFNVPPLSPPDEFSYTNQNYIILGFIVDTLFGPWENEVEEKVWRPLGMTDCGFGNFPEPEPSAVEGIWPHAQGQPDPIPQPPTWESDNPRLLGPAGTVRCSPRSYGKFLALHLDGANGRDTPVLQASSFRRLHTPYRPDSSSTYTSGGWQLFSSTGSQTNTLLGHDGSNTYNYASALAFPQLDSAAFGLTNVGSPKPDGSPAQNAMGAIIERIIDGDLADMPIIGEAEVPTNATGFAGVHSAGSRSTPHDWRILLLVACGYGVLFALLI